MGNCVISMQWQLRCHCNPYHKKPFSSLSNQERCNTTVVAIFPNLCLWRRRSLHSNLGAIDPEKPYRATLKGTLIKMFGKEAPYGSIILIYKTFRENDKKIFYFSDFFVIISRYWKGVIFSMEGFRRGYFFCQWYIKGLELRAELPHIKFCWN